MALPHVDAIDTSKHTRSWSVFTGCLLQFDNVPPQLLIFDLPLPFCFL